MLNYICPTIDTSGQLARSTSGRKMVNIANAVEGVKNPNGCSLTDPYGENEKPGKVFPQLKWEKVWERPEEEEEEEK
ncbi:hypothetical protein AGOR_G00250660 [Albula goreensis]|uniref:Uncharacterized protein n=1 Tax=Albula goreensis TaxID=1534307 RepID=A0A8T3CHB1_9TELE|nr:hypothetical protein AGOR_G00250660 [Albula goreensis]